MHSPLRPVAAGLLAGALAGVATPWAGAAAACVLLAGAAAAAAVVRTRPRAALVAAAACAAFAFAALRGAATAQGASPAEGQDVACIEGVVARAADFGLRPLAAEDGTAREATFRLRTDDALLEARLRYREGDDLPALLPGDRVRLVGEVAPLDPPTNPGERDRRAERLRAGVAGQVRVPSAGAVAALPPTRHGVVTAVRRAGEVLRRALLERLRDACGGPGPATGILACLLLGDRSSLDAEDERAFTDSGTAHLLSVSGLHVVLLAVAARAAARRVVPRPVRRRMGLASVVALLFVYCALCRFDTPVVRAAVFLAVAETARAAGRRASPLDTLAAAASLVVAVEPAQVLDPSFQLSFAAVAGLALFTRPVRAALFPALALYRKFPGAIPAARLRRLEFVATALSTSIAASAPTAPVVARVFGRIQPAAPLANLAAVPLAGFLVPAAALLALAGGALARVTAPLAQAAVAPLRAMTSVASRLPGATIETGAAPAALVALAVGLLLVAAAVAARRPRAATALLAGAWCVLGAAPFARSSVASPEIVVLDVGHGLCALARAPGSAVLFDAGGHVPGVGERTVVPALRALGVRHLGAVFLSHEDADHCSALPEVLDAVRVGEVVVSPGFGADPLPASLVALCRARGVPVTVLARGDAWRRHSVEVRILSPSADRPSRTDNAASLVAHVTLTGPDGPVTAVVPGDCEGTPLDALAADPTVPPADVLVLPHHGRGDEARHRAIARRFRARVLVASTSADAPMDVEGALVTGRDGAVRARASAAPALYPWSD